ncbi:MAG TPA: YkgJ family cysteine cluster protein [Planctomycetes bacterium]|nr:YkgJ family cysteine cluster protein [Planctomycetota bacterium]
MNDRDEDPWYADGLRFACTGCGNCCTGEPGIVRASDDEVARMAGHAGLEEAVFRDLYTHRLSSGGVALRERSGNACVFWREQVGCLIYPVRPRQCRTWPFWRANVASEGHWARAAEGCPGIDHGPLFDAEEIRACVESDGTSGVVPE